MEEAHYHYLITGQLLIADENQQIQSMFANVIIHANTNVMNNAFLTRCIDGLFGVYEEKMKENPDVFSKYTIVDFVIVNIQYLGLFTKEEFYATNK